jgi:hypothetical protein
MTDQHEPLGWQIFSQKEKAHMAEDTIHTREFQVTVGFTEERRDRFLDQHLAGTAGAPPPEASYMSEALRSEIIQHLASMGLDVKVTIVQRMEVG